MTSDILSVDLEYSVLSLVLWNSETALYNIIRRHRRHDSNARKQTPHVLHFSSLSVFSVPLKITLMRWQFHEL